MAGSFVGAASRSKFPFCSTMRMKSTIFFSLMIDGSGSRGCRIFGRLRPGQVILPGMKHRTEISPLNSIGQTIVRPARFGSVIKASSGTSIHSP